MRSFPDRPVVGVGAVILDGRQERVLLVKRAREPLKGEWSLPGGAVETGESLEAAVAREVLEEAGIVIEVGPIVEVVERIDEAADGRIEFHFVIVDYLCSPVGEASVAHGSDAEDARWVGVNDLAAYRLTEKAMSVIAKAQAIAATRNTPEGQPAR